MGACRRPRLTVIALTPLFTDLPEAVLAALIIHAVSHLWKIAEFRRYYREQRPEFWLGAATLAGVVVFDVLPGLVIGVVSMRSARRAAGWASTASRTRR